jgi:hypothetical protein
MSIPKYYESEDAFKNIHRHLKQFPCPFCRFIGCLILHGYMRGYDDSQSSVTTKRGHRIFCSNRNRRKGCGKTVSVLLAHCIKHSIFTAHSIWLFFSNALSGMSKRRSMGNVHASPSTPYRLWKRLRDNIPNIRTRLSRIAAPPDTADVPEIQTLRHLSAVFADPLNPISAFQLLFQDSFFAIESPKSGLLRA